MIEDPIELLGGSIAGWGLQAESRERPPLYHDTWRRVLSSIVAQRITGLAVDMAGSGGLELTEDQAGELLDAHRDAMTWCLHAEQKLLRLAEAFDAEGIRFAVLKGASVAHAVYLDPSLRSFGDVDLLVRTADYERACALLSGLGHVRQRPEPRAHFETRFGKASVHKHPDDEIEVDLHRTLVLGPFGLWIDPEELLERSVPFSIGGRRLARLDDTGMFVSVAMHAALGFETPRLVPLRDVAELAARGALDEGMLQDWCRRWHLTGVLRNAARETRERLGIDDPRLAALEGAGVPAREERLLTAYSNRRRAGGTAIATLAAIPSVRAKAAYLLALMVPKREFLEARSPSNASYADRWRRGWRNAAEQARIGASHEGPST